MMVMSRDGVAGKLASWGGTVLAIIAIVTLLWNISQSSSDVENRITNTREDIRRALILGKLEIRDLKQELKHDIRRNCLILAQLDFDIRQHALETNTVPPKGFKQFPNVVC